MGTRNSTLVKLDGVIKVAQYGQWDGYPTGQGQTIADFLDVIADEDNLKIFKERLKNLKEVDQETVKKWLKDELGKDDGWLTMAESEKFNKAFPGLSRDHGAGVLELIYNGEVKEIQLDPDFKEDTLFCEYWYEIDLDRNIVTMNGREFTFDQFREKGFMEKLENEEREEDE